MPALANAKHEAVLQAYLADPERVGWRAYKSVYSKSSQRAAETSWSTLMKNPEFSGRLEELKIKVATKVSETIAISAQHVFDELAKIGFSNVQDYFNGADGFVGIQKLTRDQAAAIQSLEIEPVLVKIGKAAKGKKPKTVWANKVKFKLHDKRAALVDLGKHFGLFTPKADKPDNPDEDARPITDLDAARRIAFLLEKAARSAAAKK